MHNEIIDSIAPYLIVTYVLLTAISLGLAIYFFRKRIAPSKSTYGIYAATLCIFLQQTYVVLDSVFADGDDYRWAIALLYFGALYIANIITIFLVGRNFNVLKVTPVTR